MATADSTGTPLSWDPSRNRKLTAPASASRPPASSRNGTFAKVWVRIFFCMRSSPASTSTRMPCARSAAATPSTNGTCSPVTGIATACTGASQAGKAPA